MKNTEQTEVATTAMQLVFDERISSRMKDMLTLTIQGYSREEIAKKYGLSCERTRQIVRKGINILQSRRDSYERMRNEVGELRWKLTQERMHNKYLEDVVKRHIRSTKKYYEEMPPILLTKLIDHNLSVRALNGLKSIDVDYVWEAAMLRASDMLKARNVGKKSVEEVRTFLKSCGVDFGTDIEDKYGVSLRKD